MNTENRAILERILARESLPSLSPLAVRLVELASGDEATADDLARLIEKDAGLTTRLLALVNSPAFRRGSQEITTISRAVVLLGLREVRIMALSISLRDSLPLKKGGPDYATFWRASLHRAVMAGETARRLAIRDPGEAFVAGLILELGLPLMLGALEAGEVDGFPGVGASLKRQLAWERERLGMDHRQVGVRVLAHWGLPAALAEVQRPLDQFEAHQAPLLVEVTDFARRATEAFFLPEAAFTDIYTVAATRFGFDDEAVNELLARSLAYVGDTAAALSIDLDTEADLLAVMEKANAALSRLSRRIDRVMEGDSENAARRRDEEVVMDTLEAVVHEIRNPLMSVGGFAKRLAGQVDAAGKAGRYAEVIMAEAARLDSVLAAMAELVGPVSLKGGTVDLRAILLALEEEMAQAEGEGGPPAPAWRIPPAAPTIWGDPQVMTQAVRQMIIYGSHLAAQAGGRIIIQLSQGPEGLTLVVAGPGRPPDPGRNPMADLAFGPELAWARARKMIEAHRGSLSAGPAGGEKGFVLTAKLSSDRGK